MIKKLLLLINLILISTLFISCWDVNEINQTDFPGVLAIDKNEAYNENKQENKEFPYLISMEFPVLEQEIGVDEEDNSRAKTIKTTAFSLRAALNNFQARTARWISIGMLRTVIFSHEIAEAGLFEHIEHLKRNPFAKGTIALAITEEGGRGEEVIEIDAKTTPDIGDYLDHTLKLTPREVIVPTTTLIEFFISMTSKGIEAFIPIIKYGEEDIKLDGAGIFIDDKLEKTITAEKARMLLFFRERFPTGRLSLKVDDYVISYHITEASRKIIPTYNNDKLTIKLKLELDVDIIEHTIEQRLIENEALVHKAERALESALTTQTENLLKALEECEADALGAGRVVKAKHPERFDEKRWNQDFAQADKKVDINVNVRHFGTFN